MGKWIAKARLYMQRENGLTPKGKTSHRTFSLPVRTDISKEQCLALVGVCELLTGCTITKAYLVHKRTNEILGPVVQEEKLEKEGEEVATSTGQSTSVQSARMSSVQGVQASAPTTVTAAPAPVMAEEVKGNVPLVLDSNNLFPSLEQGTSDVASNTLTTLGPGSRPGNLEAKRDSSLLLRETTVPVAAPAAVKAKAPSLLQRIHDFWIDDSYRHQEPEVKKVKMPYDMSYVDWSNTPTAQLIAKYDAERAAKAAAGGGAESTVKAATAEIKDAGPRTASAGESVTTGPKRYITRTLPEWEGTPGIEKFEVRLEDLTRSPFANTTASKGQRPEIKKLDVPLIYVEQ